MNIFCLLTGHKPYIIGMYLSETITDVNIEKGTITIGSYDDREKVCLACGKTLEVIGND